MVVHASAVASWMQHIHPQQDIKGCEFEWGYIETQSNVDEVKVQSYLNLAIDLENELWSGRE